MIRVQKIASAVLFNLGEMYARKHSDPEIIEAINTILRTLNIILINRESNWITKAYSLRVKSDKSKVPSDFAKLKTINETIGTKEFPFDGKYEILKDTMYLNKRDGTSVVNPLTLYYYYLLSDISEMEDEIDLPDIFLQLIIRYVTGIIDGTFGKTSLDTLLTNEVDDLGGASNYPFIERPMQFYV